MSLFAVYTESEHTYEFTHGRALCLILCLHFSAKPVDRVWKWAIVFLGSGLLDLKQVPLVPCCLVLRRFKDVLSIHVLQKSRIPPRECTRSSKSSSLCPGLSSLSWDIFLLSLISESFFSFLSLSFSLPSGLPWLCCMSPFWYCHGELYLLLPQPCLAMAVFSGKMYSSVMIAFLGQWRLVGGRFFWGNGESRRRTSLTLVLAACRSTVMRTWWIPTTWPSALGPLWCTFQMGRIRCPAKPMSMRSSKPSSLTTRASSPATGSWKDLSTRSAWLEGRSTGKERGQDFTVCRT